MQEEKMNNEYKEFIRVKRGSNKLVLQVLQIKWNGPHTPVSKWVTVKTLETSVDLIKLDEEIALLLNTTKYCGFCTKCERNLLKGWMHTDNYCQSCAAQEFQIVY
ncbi:hypothetical protein [Photobacterium leiognathi]|uniref:hypothetical protein n=1 Tax=Photobacterium leiognathi TaxID=553611 RepID=UPI002981CC3A|nr:hypothetical protein [Photobacterium leiognathi]